MALYPLYGKEVELYSAEEAAPRLLEMLRGATRARTNYKKRYYLDIIGTFDIETTVVENCGEPRRESGKYSHFNYCYCWQACIGGLLIFGRHISEWFNLCRFLSDKAPGAQLIMLVHNLAFEYNNLAEYFIENAENPEEDLFFKDRVHPLYIRNGIIEYRCSYQLTHKSLDRLSREIGLEKSGDLDYDRPRHSDTPMTPAEVEYCLRDVYNLYQWVAKEVVNYCKSIGHAPHACYLPLTQTGYVRYDIKHYFSQTKKGRFYLKDNELSETQYNICHAAFRGGDTHAAHFHLCKTMENVRHRDYTSAYPAKMVLEKFPWKGFRDRPGATVADVASWIAEDRAVIGTFSLRDLRLKPDRTSYIARSSCQYVSEDGIIENGRIMQADQVILTICEIDLAVILSVYDCEVEACENVMTSNKAPLPDTLIKIILKYFQQKTELKGNPEMAEIYRLSKEKLNGIYGCSATALVRPKYKANGETLETDQFPDDYKPGKVLPYQIAVYVTAYLRRDLNYFKNALGKDFIYCDTDAIYYRENADFESTVEAYNARNRQRLAALADRLGDPDLVMPRNPAGQRQYLGEFMADEDYLIEKFITVGAKRYITRRDDWRGSRVDMTFSGVGDTKAEWDGERYRPGLNVQKIMENYGQDIFKVFEDFDRRPVYLDYDPAAGKLSHYIERGDFIGTIDDGNTCQTVTARSSMVLVPIDLTLTMEKSLVDVLIYSKILWSMY